MLALVKSEEYSPFFLVAYEVIINCYCVFGGRCTIYKSTK
jgi:hypothetical protein